MPARLHLTVHQYCHFTTELIIDNETDMSGLRDPERDLRARIERIRIVLCKLGQKSGVSPVTMVTSPDTAL